MRKILLASLSLVLAACGTAAVHSGADDTNAVGSPKDTSDIQQALLALPEAHVTHWHTDNIPGHVMGNLGSAGVDVARAAQSGALQSQLAKIAPVFRLDAANLVYLRHETDELGMTHVRYQQLKNGLPVVGGELSVHVAANGRIYAVSANARDGFEVSPTPDISGDQALSTAQAHYSDAQVTLESPKLTYLFTSSDNKLVLAWEILAQGSRGLEPVKDLIYVDAHGGGVADLHPLIYAAEARKAYSANNGTNLPGTLKRSEGQAATGDAALDAAYDNTGYTWQFYKTIFNRDSYDNAGATLISTVHYDQSYDNAYWDGTQMVYGDGDGSTFKPLSEAIDVTAHELTHAVTERTANLTYSGQSGGLNEAMSDIMGNTAETWAKHNDVVGSYTWLVGEDIYTPGTSGDALRYMNDPAKDGSSLDWAPDYNSSVDVHYSSGIPNLAYYLTVVGGTHPRNKSNIQVTGIGLDKARRIYYRALTTYFNSNTDFAGALAGTKQAALDLYDAATAASVEAAWNAVGVGSSGGSTGSATALTNGVAVSISGATGSSKYYKLDVPAGATNLKFAISGGSGDADLYVKFGSLPTTSSYDCRPYVSGNSESCPISTASAGTYYVMINGYAAYSGVSLVGSFSTSGGTSTSSGGTSSGSTSGTTTSGSTSGGTTSGSTSGSTSSGGTSGGTSGAIPLQNGVAVSPISAATGSNVLYAIAVPSGASNLSITISGGTGDADLYVKLGSAPTLSSYDCRPYLNGNSESCSFATPSTGTYYVMLNAYQGFSGVKLLASYSTGGGTGGGTGSSLQNGVPVTGLSGASGSKTYFTFDVPSGKSQVKVSISGGTGDADLYVRFGADPTLTTYDCRPYVNGNGETCTLAAQAGTYHLMLNGYAAYSGVTLTGTYQ